MAEEQNTTDVFLEQGEAFIQDVSEDTPSEMSDANSYTSDTPLIKDTGSDHHVEITYDLTQNAIRGVSEAFIQDGSNLSEGTPSELSDANSYTSDSPLIKDAGCDHNVQITYDMTQNVTADIHDDLAGTDHMDTLSVPTHTYTRQTSETYGHSVLDIHDYLDGCEDVEVHIQPLSIIGAGWECGSVSSLYHIAASRDTGVRPLAADKQSIHGSIGYRSRLGTMDQQSHQGSLAYLPQNRLLSRVFANSISSFQFNKKGYVIEDLHKSIILDKDETCQQEIDLSPHTEVKPRNFKNLCAVSIGLTILYFAIGGLRNLQSSLNAEDGVGVISLAATFASFTISSLISPFIVQMYRPKLCLIVGFVSHIFFVFANYCPKLVYFIPSSVILGFGNALTWNAACTYITEIAVNEADWKMKFPSHVLSRYFGFFFLTYQSSTVFGNLISSLILVPKTLVSNSTIDILTNSNYSSDPLNTSYGYESNDLLAPSLSQCGARFSNRDSGESASLNVDEFDKLFLLGTYATCVIIAIVTIVIFLDHLPNYAAKSARVTDVLIQARDIFLMVVDKKFVFIVVLCLYTVIGNGFVVADTLRGYVTCPLGIYMVGYTMICFGICGAMSSFIFGKLQKYTGRVPIFLLATLINIVSLVVMVTWHPTADDIYYIFGLLGAWGFADGIWQSQTISLISSVFADKYEAALGCCRFLQGIAGITVFLLSDMLEMKTKITVVLGTCLLGFIFYMVMEVSLRCGKGNQQGVTEKQVSVNVK